MENNNFSEQALSEIINQIRNRHTGAYQGLINKIVGQISEYQKNHKNIVKFIIGISGGIDSTVAAYLAKLAVGEEKLLPIYIPARDDVQEMKYFENVSSFLGVKNAPVVYIKEAVENLVKKVEKIVGHELHLINKGNIASRLRINIFFAVAREHEGVVLGTSNRSEFVQGYATKYGTPMSCDFGILDDLYKTDIIEIAKIADVPENVLNRQPSTGFYEGQTHEEELMATMKEQDAAAFLLFEKNMGVESIVEKYGASNKYLDDFMVKYANSLHKRKLQSEHVKLGFIKSDVIQ